MKYNRELVSERLSDLRHPDGKTISLKELSRGIIDEFYKRNLREGGQGGAWNLEKLNSQPGKIRNDSLCTCRQQSNFDKFSDSKNLPIYWQCADFRSESIGSQWS